MNEFELIRHYFHSTLENRSDVLLGPGDDCAVLSPCPGKCLCVSTDTMVVGTHFLANWPASAIAHRALAANLSDLAAMGATPCWFSLSLTLPEVDTTWLNDFSTALFRLAANHQLALVGGDISKGPLSITITIHGQADKHDLLYRHGAKEGDRIYLTNALGLNQLALAELTEINNPAKKALFKKLLYPSPRLNYLPMLNQYANAAIDISDGLYADLSHILNASQLGAVIQLDSLPIHKQLANTLNQEQAWQYALQSGEEYELCFTVSKDKSVEFEAAINKTTLPYFYIGDMVKEQQLLLNDRAGKPWFLPTSKRGYQHF